MIQYFHSSDPEYAGDILHVPIDSEEKFVPATDIRQARKNQEQLLKEDEEREAALELRRTIEEILARRGV